MITHLTPATWIGFACTFATLLAGWCGFSTASIIFAIVTCLTLLFR